MAKMSRNYTFIVYPEESCKSWISEIASYRIATLLSPVHSPVNDNGDELKKHVHVMFSFGGKKSLDTMVSITEGLRSKGIACTVMQAVTDKISMESYFIHKGYPDKEQFEYKDLTVINGYKLNYSEPDTDYTMDILVWCNTAGCFNYVEVVDYALMCMPEWLDTLMGRKAYAINKYLENSYMRISRSAVRREKYDR